MVQDNAINAFAGPGGYVYVNTGLIRSSRNAGELAAVMSHEISHVTLRHVSKAVARQQVAAIGPLVGEIYKQPTLGQVAGTGVGIYNLKFDRQAEAEADRSGVAMMYRAGFDPYSMVTMFQLLQTEAGGRGGFLSSHPGTGQRIGEVQSYIRQLPPRTGLIRSDTQFAGVQARVRSMSGSQGYPRFGNPGSAGIY